MLCTADLSPIYCTEVCNLLLYILLSHLESLKRKARNGLPPISPKIPKQRGVKQIQNNLKSIRRDFKRRTLQLERKLPFLRKRALVMLLVNVKQKQLIKRIRIPQMKVRHRNPSKHIFCQLDISCLCQGSLFFIGFQSMDNAMHLLMLIIFIFIN